MSVSKKMCIKYICIFCLFWLGFVSLISLNHESRMRRGVSTFPCTCKVKPAVLCQETPKLQRAKPLLPDWNLLYDFKPVCFRTCGNYFFICIYFPTIGTEMLDSQRQWGYKQQGKEYFHFLLQNALDLYFWRHFAPGHYIISFTLIHLCLLGFCFMYSKYLE